MSEDKLQKLLVRNQQIPKRPKNDSIFYILYFYNKEKNKTSLLVVNNNNNNNKDGLQKNNNNKTGDWVLRLHCIERTENR